MRRGQRPRVGEEVPAAVVSIGTGAVVVAAAARAGKHLKLGRHDSAHEIRLLEGGLFLRRHYGGTRTPVFQETAKRATAQGKATGEAREAAGAQAPGFAAG